MEAVTPESYAFDEEYLVNAYPVGGGYSELSDGALMRIKSNYSESMAYLNESGILGRMDDADDKYAYDYTDENGVHHIS